MIPRLKEARLRAGKTQNEIAEILQTTQYQYHKYETGKQELPIRHLITLCKYDNVTTDWMLGLKN